MNVKIRDCGIVRDGDREMDTLEGEVFPRVLSEQGLDLATYAGYSYVRPKLVGPDVARLNVFGTGQEIGYRLLVDNLTDEQTKIKFLLSVRNSSGRTLGEAAPIAVVVPPRQRTAQRIAFSLDSNGTYVLAYRAETPHRSFEGKINFAVVPPQNPELAAVSPFGLHAGHCRLLEAANMRWARNGQLVFAEELSDRENRDWTTFEQVLHAAERHRITLIPVIQCNPTKRWTAAPLKEYNRFRSFVRDLVDHFKDRQKVWEIVNEPNIEGFSPEQYFEALEAGYRGAKQADPHCTLVMGGTAYIDMPYIQRLGELGLAELCDVVSVHPYYPGEPPEGELLVKLKEVQKWRDRQSPGKPMWSTEIAWWTGGKDKVDPQTLCNYLARSTILQLAYGQEVVLWTTGVDRQWDPRLVDSGLYRLDFTPKENYVVFAALSRLLSGKQFVGVSDRGKEVFAFRFEGRGESVEALWTTGEDREVDMLVGKPSTLLDAFANQIEEYPAGEVRIPLSQTPVYVL